MMKIKTMYVSFAVLLFILLACLPVMAASDPGYYYEAVDVYIDVRTNGDLAISETQEFRFQSGHFRGGYRKIPMDKLISIYSVQVSEGKQQYPSNPDVKQWVQNRITGKVIGPEETGFATWYEDNQFWIGWWFPTITSGIRIIKIDYAVHGALRIHDDIDRLYWKAIWPDRRARVSKANVTVHLPGAVDPARIILDSYGTPAGSRINDSGSIVYTALDMSPKSELEILVSFPHGLVQASPPPWQDAVEKGEAEKQAELERRSNYNDQVKPYIDLILILLGLVVIPLAAFIWIRGVFRNGGSVAKVPRDYGSQYSPPGDLPPALVGLLYAGSSNMGLISTIFDLARRGSIRIDVIQQKAPFFTAKDLVLTRLNHNSKYEFEQMALEKLTSERGEKLSDKRTELPALLKEFNKSVESESVRQGLFTSTPSESGKKLSHQSVIIMSVSVILIIILLIIPPMFASEYAGFMFYAGFVFLPLLVLMFAGITAFFLSFWLLSYTEKGAQQAAACEAFGKYLKQMSRDRQLATESLYTWDSYFPYAMVFGLARPWITQFSRLDAPAPAWFYVYHPSGSVSADIDAPASLSSIQGAFNSMASTISGSSSSSW